MRIVRRFAVSTFLTVAALLSVAVLLVALAPDTSGVIPVEQPRW